MYFTQQQGMCSVEILIFGGWPAFKGLHMWHISNILDTLPVQAISQLTSSPVFHPYNCLRGPRVTLLWRNYKWIADYKEDKLQQGDEYVTRIQEETEKLQWNQNWIHMNAVHSSETTVSHGAVTHSEIFLFKVYHRCFSFLCFNPHTSLSP